MKQFQTEGIVLKRIDFGESDRIVTVITKESGKLTLLARGVRKVKSKLAGGIELLTVNELVVIEGKSDLKTLRSARMAQHFSNVATDFHRLAAGYAILKAIDTHTEEAAEAEYFTLAHNALQYLNKLVIPADVTQLWFHLRLLGLLGRQPDLRSDVAGLPLNQDSQYVFNASEEGLIESRYGVLGADHIKLARLCERNSPDTLFTISGVEELARAWIRQLPPLAEA